MRSYSLIITLSFFGAGTTIGPALPSAPVTLGCGVDVLGGADPVGPGVVVEVCRLSVERRAWLFCLCLESLVLVFLASAWEVVVTERG